VEVHVLTFSLGHKNSKQSGLHIPKKLQFEFLEVQGIKISKMPV